MAQIFRDYVSKELLVSVTTTHHDAIRRWNTPNRKRRNAGISSQILKGLMHKTGKRKKFNSVESEKKKTFML